MIELILAKMSDNGQDFSDYPETMQAFFTHLAGGGGRELVAFNDYYPASKVGTVTTPIKIIDPVNPDNNVSLLYTEHQTQLIEDAAMDASDAIDSALYATTKQDTVRYWQKVFGPSFNP
jgi:hypothetical protein